MTREGVKKYQPTEEALEIIRNLRLIDDDFMSVFFNQNYEATELILNIILNRKDITVKTIEVRRLRRAQLPEEEV